MYLSSAPVYNAELHGYEAHGIGRKEDKTQTYIGLRHETRRIRKDVCLCIENKECEDLEKRKIYQAIPDKESKKEGYLRIIDESEEDYLYPESYFIMVHLPRKAQDALQLAS